MYLVYNFNFSLAPYLGVKVPTSEDLRQNIWAFIVMKDNLMGYKIQPTIFPSKDDNKLLGSVCDKFLSKIKNLF